MLRDFLFWSLTNGGSFLLLINNQEFLEERVATRTFTEKDLDQVLNALILSI